MAKKSQFFLASQHCGCDMDLRRTKNNNNNNNNSSLTGGSLHNSFSFVFFPLLRVAATYLRICWKLGVGEGRKAPWLKLDAIGVGKWAGNSSDRERQEQGHKIPPLRASKKKMPTTEKK
jgi:hypothetical protein